MKLSGLLFAMALCAFALTQIVAGGPALASATPAPHATTAGGSHQIGALSGCMNQWLFNGVWRIRVTKLESIKHDYTNVPGYAVTIDARNGSHTTTSMAYSGVDGSGTLVLEDGTALQQDTDEEIAWHTPYYQDQLPSAGFHFTLKYYLPAMTDSPPKPQKWIFPIDPSKEGGSAPRYTAHDPSLRVNLRCDVSHH